MLACALLAWAAPAAATVDPLARELAQAAARGDVESVRSALDRGAPIDAVVPVGLSGTALEKAAAEGHGPVVELLLARGASVRTVRGTGLNATHWAAVGGHTGVLRTLVEHAAPDDPDSALSSALVAAAAGGHRDAVAYLLERGVPVDAVPPRPQMPTALEAAAERGHGELAGILLDHGAQPRVIEERGVPAAEGAAAHGDLALLRRIADAVEPHDDPRALYGPALAQASRAGHAPVVVELLARGADPDFGGSRGLIIWTEAGQSQGVAPAPPLAFAGEGGHWTVVRVLLDADADPGPAGLLHHAARWGNLGLVRQLLEGGVDLQAEGSCGNALTVLAYDPRGRQANVEATARFLLDEGIDANVACHGKRPLRWAREHGDTELASLLEEAGAADGTTLGFKLRRLGKTIQSAGLVVALLLGGGM
jgi:ankyrin repeat protein